jgi:dCMP deaminase
MTDLTRPDWDEYFLDGVEWVAARADCRRRKAGAIIVRDRRVVSTGYNGAPAGDDGCLAGHCPRGLLGYDDVLPLSSYDTGPGSCIAVHAEANALLYASRDMTEGATLYVTGEPCMGCRRLVRGSGIIRVVYRNESGQVVEEAAQIRSHR